MLTGRKILIGITGSIAAYKIAGLVRLLIKAGAEVKVIMTASATQFITPLTLSTLSRNEVMLDLSDGRQWTNHVMLGRWADVFLIAPLSCNTLSKMAAGACDNLLLATYLSSTAPVVVAPAMDEDMWLHASTRRNLQTISGFGNKVIDVSSGELASGLVGEGRMAEPEALLSVLETMLEQQGDLTGLKALVTAGPTHEPIDPVRFIGNHSSGRMGIAVAEALAERGAVVEMILGPTSLRSERKDITVKTVTTAAEMYEAAMLVYESKDIVVMAAAVADFRPAQVSGKKIKKESGAPVLELEKTEDILSEMGRRKRSQTLVGFALETDNELLNAQSKLDRKNADIIVLNSLQEDGAGFGHNTNKVTILHRTGETVQYSLKSKQQVARDIVDNIVKARHV
jgi:phosphopantothenoylcysteine decarboxylase/phosphopantothenate--cysteine ligase